MKIIEALKQLKVEIPELFDIEQKKLNMLATHFECKGHNALISEAQCLRLQERAKFFSKNQSEYFSTGRYNKKKPKTFLSRRYGLTGESIYYQPQDLACLECEKYRKGR